MIKEMCLAAWPVILFAAFVHMSESETAPHAPEADASPEPLASVSQPTVRFVFTVEEPNGEAFHGDLEVTISQEITRSVGGRTGSGKMTWGSHTFRATGGAVDETITLPNLKSGEAYLEMSPDPSADFGLVRLQHRVTLDATKLRRSGFYVEPRLDPSGQATVRLVDPCRLATPPSIGSVLVSSAAHAVAEVEVCPVVGANRRRIREALCSKVMLPTGSRQNLYSWSRQLRSFELHGSAGAGAELQLGSTIMRAASSCTISLHSVGAIHVASNSTIDDVTLACLWPSDSYEPLDLDSSPLPPSALVISRGTFCEHRGVWSRTLSAKTIQYNDLPVGSYTLEVWRLPGVKSGTASHVVHQIAVTAGRTTQLRIP